MQYLLTQAELDALNASGQKRAAASKVALQRACTLAAKHTPIVVDWHPDKTPRPWGCILDKDSNPGYCDECPVREACPNDDKEWSK